MITMQPLASEAAPDCGSSGLVVVSVVSHGHKHQVQGLLNDLVRFSRGRISRVVLTLNQPEAAPQPPAAGWPFALHIVRNIRPLGFGANHNRALSGAGEPFVCVLNPDVRWDGMGVIPWKRWFRPLRSQAWAVRIRFR